MAGGRRGCAEYCRAVPAICSKEIGGGKNVFRGISVEGPGGGAGLLHGPFFALVGKERTYILHELKDKEFVQWLLNHPEVFEKLAFAKASGKNTLAVLRNIWVKEGKELSGVGLNMALGAALISTSREPEACEARYDFTKSLLRRKNFFRSSLRWNRGNSAFFSGAGKVLRSLPGHRITWLAKRRSRRGTQGMPVAV